MYITFNLSIIAIIDKIQFIIKRVATYKLDIQKIGSNYETWDIDSTAVSISIPGPVHVVDVINKFVI